MTSSFAADTKVCAPAWCSGSVATGLLVYALSSSIVILALSFGRQFVTPPVHAPARLNGALESLMGTFRGEDSDWYMGIAVSGYEYDPEKRSSVAFFPLYPLLAAGVIQYVGLGPAAALLLVSHTCLAAAFILAAMYLRGRLPPAGHAAYSYTLLAMGLMPATLFLRMIYSEASFFLVCILFLFSMQRRWPLLVVAFIAGFASASRPVGVALLLPLLIYTWRSSHTFYRFLPRAVFVVSVGSWGLLAYVAYLNAQFGEPLAFVKTQVHWGSPSPSLTSKLPILLSFQPIWEIFLKRPVGEWSVFDWDQVNPVYFVLTVAAVLYGAHKCWLTSYESILAIGLLLIPYWTKGYETSMASQARYAAVVFPVYIVLGNLLARLPGYVAPALLSISAFFLSAFTALYATGHLIF